ncbi:PucR family transcriptional regulator [Fictibacillus sp. FJAT-27399]|uniref:PucR family transcriptional regulator n=1 Tax=Fictibacillus sp. FJAT-27399 TaxID=1729689 RepID=UPI000780F056|nr:PucR family transcriptional regulator [Fictibacillus sp. FJAT-27399]
MHLAGVTIRELLRLPVLKDAKVISGEKGLSRIVRFVDIMEVPDVEGWLREGELLLTTAYSIRHDTALLSELVEQLVQAGAAALAIKPERFIYDMPLEMIKVSNHHNLPIIELPSGVPYMDITHSVMEQIIDKQASLLRRSDEIFKTLTTLVLENSGIQAVADNVSALVKSPIWVIDKSGETIVSSPSTLASPQTRDNTRCWDITVDKQFVGKLILNKEQLDDLEVVCVEQARLVFSLELMRRKTVLDTENKLRGDFIEELLTGLPFSKQEVESKGAKFGLMPGWIWEIAIIEAENCLFDEGSPFLMQLHERLKQELPKGQIKAHIHKQGQRLVLLLASPRLEDSSINQTLSHENSESWKQIFTPLIEEQSGICIGFGEKCFLWEVQRSYLEAKKSIMIGMRMEKHGKVFMFKEIEMFQMLLDAADYINMDTFVEKKIGMLCQHDKENGTDLVSTFYYYLASGGSLIHTANHLFIHRNSVKYRMNKIRDIVGIDLENFRERFVYYCCLTYHLLKK